MLKAGHLPTSVALLHAAVALVASCHAVLTKDEPRAAVGWIGLIWLSPFVGSLLYYLLGINRIRRKAVALGRESGGGPLLAGEALVDQAGLGGRGLESLARLGDRVTTLPLSPGNAVEPLVNGEAAYPAMLAAINGAQRSIMLSSYIFDYDDAGREFLVALGAAVKRGVQVRVLVDATGARYSFPSIVPRLRRVGITAARFMPNLYPTRMSAFNLRSHRKILVVDGQVGFTGGMNIRQGNYVGGAYRHKVQDLHFRVRGPVVAHLRLAFVEDWAFTTKETLTGDVWLPPLAPAGQVLARGVLDGPDSDFEKTLWTMLGAIAEARHSIRIVTPYFLPEPETIRFLNVAAMAGVQVEIVLPQQNNIKLVEWATMAVVPHLLTKGCRVFLSPPPFDHTKMMLIDDAWAFIGSANWDARSLRLNFEFNIECYSSALAGELGAICRAKRDAAGELTPAMLAGRRLPARLRDGVVRLLAPYL